MDEKTKNNVLYHLSDYDKVKEKLIIRLLNYKANKEEIKLSVHRRVGDIALVLYVVLSDNTDRFTSVKVTNNFLKQWKLEQDSVIQEAMFNTNLKYPPRVYDWLKDTFEPDYQAGAFMNLLTDIQLQKGYRANCVTNVIRLNGAAAVFYPGVTKRIAALLEDDFYIVFTSIHEAMIHGMQGVRKEKLLEGLLDVNRYNEPYDKLTDQIYCYRDSLGEISILV